MMPPLRSRISFPGATSARSFSTLSRKAPAPQFLSNILGVSYEDSGYLAIHSEEASYRREKTRNPKLVERALAPPRDKYCSVWHSLNADMDRQISFEVRKPGTRDEGVKG